MDRRTIMQNIDRICSSTVDGGDLLFRVAVHDIVHFLFFLHQVGVITEDNRPYLAQVKNLAERSAKGIWHMDVQVNING